MPARHDLHGMVVHVTARILGLDPGFASFGWAVVQLGRRDVCLDAGVWRTKKSPKRCNVTSASDMHRRGAIIAQSLMAVVARYKPVVACAEALSTGFPNTITMIQLGRAWGILDAMCVQHNMPIVEATPQDIKLATTGKRSASKGEVMASILELYPEVAPMFARIKAKTQLEHPSDALGAVVACDGSEVVRMARRMGAT